MSANAIDYSGCLGSPINASESVWLLLPIWFRPPHGSNRGNTGLVDMSLNDTKTLEEIYPLCRGLLQPDAWYRVKDSYATAREFEEFPELLSRQVDILSLPGYLPELAELEWNLHRLKTAEVASMCPVSRVSVNPDLYLIRLSWKNLTAFLSVSDRRSLPPPEPGEEYALVWRHPKSGEIAVCAAATEDLLALKLVVEEVDARKVAAEGQITMQELDEAIDRAGRKGLLLVPPPGIRRDPSSFPIGEDVAEGFLSPSVFTLQWHITQACDLHCKHCYDRSQQRAVDLRQAIAILDDLYEFCRRRRVRGQVSFSGGNPLLYPHFLEVYRAAAERGFALAILGNPTTGKVIESLNSVDPPVFYQVSLEGLQEHNDSIRGSGHFHRVLEFLDVLRSLEVYSMVMLTLTRDNLGQVIPLADLLRGRTDLFTFNRLSLVGEGANLQLPSKRDYEAFLQAYTDAAEKNPIIALKDNLINIVRLKNGMPSFGGCTGYGCGAAFNFLSLLADGSVHACRKFPSPIGNVLETGLGELYDSEPARLYRAGCSACRSCVLRPVCGGCLAAAYSLGLNPLEERDPYCFITQE
jgi:selenobiotic family peptide radical SAM maturase